MSSLGYDVVGAYTYTAFSLQRFVIHRRSSATPGLKPFSLTIWSFHFLFMIKRTPSWLLFALGGRFIRQ